MLFIIPNYTHLYSTNFQPICSRTINHAYRDRFYTLPSTKSFLEKFVSLHGKRFSLNLSKCNNNFVEIRLEDTKLCFLIQQTWGNPLRQQKHFGTFKIRIIQCILYKHIHLYYILSACLTWEAEGIVLFLDKFFQLILYDSLLLDGVNEDHISLLKALLHTAIFLACDLKCNSDLEGWCYLKYSATLWVWFSCTFVLQFLTS